MECWWSEWYVLAAALMLCTVGRFDGDMFVIGVSSKLLQKVFSIMRAIRCASSKSKTWCD